VAESFKLEQRHKKKKERAGRDREGCRCVSWQASEDRHHSVCASSGPLSIAIPNQR